MTEVKVECWFLLGQSAFLPLRCGLRRLHEVACEPQDQEGSNESDEGVQVYTLTVKAGTSMGGSKQRSTPRDEGCATTTEETEVEDSMASAGQARAAKNHNSTREPAAKSTP